MVFVARMVLLPSDRAEELTGQLRDLSIYAVITDSDLFLCLGHLVSLEAILETHYNRDLERII